MNSPIGGVGMCVAPVLELSAGRAQHPIAETDDDAGLFGDRDNPGRRDRFTLDGPAQERLGGDRATVSEIDDRLKGKVEAILGEGVLQLALDPPPLGMRPRGPGSDGDPVAAFLLRAVEGVVGVAEQCLDAVVVAAAERDTDAASERYLAVLEGDRSDRASRTRSAHRMASSASARSSRTTTNSSPPTRDGVAVAQRLLAVAATSCARSRRVRARSCR